MNAGNPSTLTRGYCGAVIPVNICLLKGVHGSSLNSKHDLRAKAKMKLCCLPFLFFLSRTFCPAFTLLSLLIAKLGQRTSQCIDNFGNMLALVIHNRKTHVSSFTIMCQYSQKSHFLSLFILFLFLSYPILKYWVAQSLCKPPAI